MPRGVPLTPGQLAVAAEAYARTGSYADAGRAIDVDESVARRALLRGLEAGGESERVALHARAIDRGLRDGRRALTEVNGKLRKKITGSSKIGELVSISKGLSLSVARLADLAELELKRRQAHLTRAKTRAEIRSLEKGAPTPEQVLAALQACLVQAASHRLHQLRQGSPRGGLPNAIFLFTQGGRTRALGSVLEHQSGKRCLHDRTCLQKQHTHTDVYSFKNGCYGSV